VIGSVPGSLARAPSAPENFTATGNSVEGIRIKFDQSEHGRADHYLAAISAQISSRLTLSRQIM